jgi:predicted ester cyclase
MKTVFAASAALAAVLFAGSPASAEITVDSARTILAPFYKALNAEFVKDAPELVRQTTTPDWKTCRGNDACNSRDEVMAGIGQRLKAIPDLKWEMKEVLVAGNHVIVRGEATGTPSGELMGNATNGKSFKLMSIDMHTLEGDKIARTYHVEDWQGAFRQMSAAK